MSIGSFTLVEFRKTRANRRCEISFGGLLVVLLSSLGRAEAFLLASAAIVLWAVLGPVYRYSDTWQLVINTATTIITFLMVFLIQKTQNRDAKAAPRSRHTAGEGQDIDHVYLDPRDGQPTATTLGLC